DNTEWQRDVSVSLNRIGDVRLRAGDAAGAVAAYEQGLAIARRLAETDSDNTGWQRVVSISLDRIGDVKLRAGDAAGAVAAYEEGLAIHRRLAETDPDNTEWHTDVVVSLWKVQGASENVGRRRALLEEAHSILATHNCTIDGTPLKGQVK
ncbi:MAG: tetratricopeptide repeat protein, partial [bacterium]|nr:tetratricopeptide repeat protein [bacterium]